jgi:long-chain fatty acid transport protein
MFHKFRSSLLISITLLFLVSTVYATDGYFRHGYGIKYSALAGSGIAVNLSSLGAISNPAGLAYFDGCSRYDVNVAMFSPDRQYTVTGNPSGFPGTFGLTPGTVSSDSKTFFFPTLGANWKVNNDMAIGLAVYGNGGMNTDYPTATFYDPNSPGTGVNLEQLFAAATYAIKFSEQHAIGVSAIFGWQRFAAKGLLSFAGFSSDPNSLTGNVHSTSTGFGGKIGYQGQFGKVLRFGASYQTKIFMSEFKEYKGLFAEAGDFDVPSSWSAGIAVMPNEQWTFILDFQQILYSGVKSIANKMDLVNNSPMLPNGQPNPNFQALGTDGGWGFGWEDVSVVKFGVMAKVGEGWTIMGGYSYNSQPIPDSEVMFNILAPAVVQHHITLGVTKEINKSNEINLGFMYAPAGKVSGANPLEAPGAQTIELQMSQFQVEIGYAFSSF